MRRCTGYIYRKHARHGRSGPDGLSKAILILKNRCLSNFLLRSGFKISDQVQGQGAGRSGKRSIHRYVSIYRRSATRPLGLRWAFETTSRASDKPSNLYSFLRQLRRRRQYLPNGDDDFPVFLSASDRTGSAGWQPSCSRTRIWSWA
jgi:hypothetical protein